MLACQFNFQLRSLNDLEWQRLNYDLGRMWKDAVWHTKRSIQEYASSDWEDPRKLQKQPRELIIEYMISQKGSRGDVWYSSICTIVGPEILEAGDSFSIEF
jgi:hypothetical protein